MVQDFATIHSLWWHPPMGQTSLTHRIAFRAAAALRSLELLDFLELASLVAVQEIESTEPTVAWWFIPRIVSGL